LWVRRVKAGRVLKTMPWKQQERNRFDKTAAATVMPRWINVKAQAGTENRF